MDLARTPLPRRKVVFLALRAHTAAVELRHGQATIDEWRCLCEAFNTINALHAMGKVTCELDAQSLWTIHRVLSRTPRDDDAPIAAEETAMASIARMVSIYDECLQKLARRTIEEAMDFIDYAIVRMVVPDGGDGSAPAERPPMLPFKVMRWQRPS